jgi:hypothetical protein
MHWIYYIWILLPLVFLLLSLRAVYRRVAGIPRRESPVFFLAQAAFCFVALGLTWWIDTTIFPSIVDVISFGMFDVDVARWVLYPAVLVLLAYLQEFAGLDLFKKDPKKRVG